MSTPPEVSDVVVYLAKMANAGRVSRIAFALVRDDGVPEIGHANSSYELLGATELCKAGQTAKLFDAATPTEGFEPTEPEDDA